LDLPITPVPVFLRHPTNQHLDFGHRARSSGPAGRAAIVFPGDQLPVPSQQSLRRDDCRNPSQQFTASPLGLDCEPTALVIVESHSATAALLPKNSIFLQKILDNVVLMLVHPSSHGNNHHLKWVQD
jgi:hypothetical protein